MINCKLKFKFQIKYEQNFRSKKRSLQKHIGAFHPQRYLK